MKKFLFIISLFVLLSACEPVCYIIVNTDQNTNVEESKGTNSQSITIKKKGL